MTHTHLSWLASALLRSVASRNEALAGDLEELRDERSPGWFWLQLVWAALTTSPEPSAAGAVGPRIVQEPGSVRPARLQPLDPTTMNLSGIRVQGIGGLSLIAVVLLISLTMPAAWWLAAMGLSGGIVLGVALVVRRRRLGFSSGGGPTTLFGAGSSACPDSGVESDREAHPAALRLRRSTLFAEALAQPFALSPD
jgi:hypothetical protein